MQILTIFNWQIKFANVIYVKREKVFITELQAFPQFDRRKKERPYSRRLAGRRWIASTGIQRNAIHLRLLNGLALLWFRDMLLHHVHGYSHPRILSSPHLFCMRFSLVNSTMSASIFFVHKLFFFYCPFKSTKPFLAGHSPLVCPLAR